MFSYCRLQHKDVFDLIKKHNLYDVISKSIVPLIQLDSEKAIAMLLERNKIAADVVVDQLQNHEEYLYLVSIFIERISESPKFWSHVFNSNVMFTLQLFYCS